MSTVWIAVLLVVPIVAVITALNMSLKKQKKKADRKTQMYLHQVLEHTGVVNSYQKELVHQLVILDESNRKLLIVDHVDNTYSHTLHHLDDIKSMQVVNIKQLIPADEKNKKSETFTSQIGLEISAGNTADSKRMLLFYDHIKHSLYLMTEMEKEAQGLMERIKQASKKKQLAT